MNELLEKAEQIISLTIQGNYFERLDNDKQFAEKIHSEAYNTFLEIWKNLFENVEDEQALKNSAESDEPILMALKLLYITGGHKEYQRKFDNNDSKVEVLKKFTDYQNILFNNRETYLRAKYANVPKFYVDLSELDGFDYKIIQNENEFQRSLRNTDMTIYIVLHSPTEISFIGRGRFNLSLENQKWDVGGGWGWHRYGENFYHAHGHEEGNPMTNTTPWAEFAMQKFRLILEAV